MFRYEVLMLTVPEITADEATALESQFEAITKEHRATTLSFERWGKYRLAYPVKKNDYGVYFLARFEAGVQDYRTLVEALRVFLMVKNEELVMRHMIARLDVNAPLVYQRPESLEEAPVRDSESFFKENKMTGFLGKPGTARAADTDLSKQDIDESL
jgi:small subunit ribosomal protein S6